MAQPNNPYIGITPEETERVLESALEQSYRYSAAGSHSASYQATLSEIDRFGHNRVLPHKEVTGLTFITRPRLNLTTQSLRQAAITSTLDTRDPQSFPFAIRAYLDTAFSRDPRNTKLVERCPFINIASPFLTPLTNNLIGISGWPDFILDTETSASGFYAEDQTMVRGSDFLNRTYDLTLTFQEIQGNFNKAILFYWVYWMALAARGITVAYPNDIAARRLCYTCSIYRFTLDPSRRYIMNWAKATGCFPVSVPMGTVFNITNREPYIQSSHQFSIPFRANHVEINDPHIFADFNTLVERYAGRRYWSDQGKVSLTNEPQYNFRGLPWIDVYNDGHNTLTWWEDPDAIVDPAEETLSDIRERIRRRMEFQRNRPDVDNGPETDVDQSIEV